MLRKLSNLARPNKVAVQLICDGLVVSIAFIMAMILRVEEKAFDYFPRLWLPLIIAIFLTVIFLNENGIYRVLIRFVNGKIFIPIAKACVVGALGLYLASLILGAAVPRSVPIIFAILTCLGIGALRFLARAWFRQPLRRQRKPVLIYGAGQAGLQLLNSLFHAHSYDPAAFIDDDESLHGFTVGGLRVYDPRMIGQIVDITGAQTVLLALPNISRSKRRQIISGFEGLSLEIKTIPSFRELIEGSAKITHLRDLQPEDLLGRDPIEAIPDLLGRSITGKSVLVSGAGGSIGSELCRQILSQCPERIVLFEVSEYALYRIESELAGYAAQVSLDVKIIAVLGSVQDKERVRSVVYTHRVQTIYHAAAYKHVPIVEENVVEGVRNNVLGTFCMAQVAMELEVERFILISTDKAVRPANIMGATKRIAELICQGLSQESSKTIFAMVRFGNVLGSSGSVIPKFRSQIEAGGPVTVTHEDITRYFMTIPEASQLVIQAGALATGGDVFVLDMGDPVRIMDLAIEMIKLHGLVPLFEEQMEQIEEMEGVIEIRVTGLRKGEKLYEELLIGSTPLPTVHPRIMTASERALPFQALIYVIELLSNACDEDDVDRILQILHELPLDYAPPMMARTDDTPATNKLDGQFVS